MSFTAAFLTSESKTQLLDWWKVKFADKFPLLPRPYAEHMTIKFRPDHYDLVLTPMGAIVTLEVIGYAANDRGQAVVVRCPRVYSTNEVPHITISTNGCPPVYSNDLLKGEWTPIDGPKLYGVVDRSQGSGRQSTSITKSSFSLVTAIDSLLPMSTSLTSEYVKPKGRDSITVQTTTCRWKSHSIEYVIKLKLSKLRSDLSALLEKLPPSDINLEIGPNRICWPVHRYVLATSSTFLQGELYPAGRHPPSLRVFSLHQEDRVLQQAAEDIDGAEEGPTIDCEADESGLEATVLRLLLLFYDDSKNTRTVAESGQPSFLSILSFMKLVSKWNIPDVGDECIVVLDRKLRSIMNVQELLDFGGLLKSHSNIIYKQNQNKLHNTIWKCFWKQVKSSGGGVPGYVISGNYSSRNPGTKDVVPLPLNVAHVREVATYVADFVTSEGSSSKEKEDLFKLEMKLKEYIHSPRSYVENDNKTTEAEACAICLEVLLSSNSCTLSCEHSFHSSCVSDLRSKSSSPVCPLCRTELSYDSRNVKSCAGNCGYLKHSQPLPGHFSQSDKDYCCSLCRMNGGGMVIHGNSHGGHCERLMSSQEDREYNEVEKLKNNTEVSAVEWVNLFTPLLLKRETKQLAASKLDAYDISIDESFSQQVTRCLLKNISEHMFEEEALELIRKNNFALLFQFMRTCDREEMVEVFSMSDKLGLGVAEYQQALLSSKPSPSHPNSRDVRLARLAQLARNRQADMYFESEDYYDYE